MIILIPLGGKGQRFRDQKDSKCSVPKALIEVEGKPIIFWLLDNMLVKFPRPDDLEYIYIPYHRDYDDHDFENKVRERYPDVKFKFLLLSKDTEGAAHTINIALKNIINNEDNNQDKAVPIICIDSDNFYTADIISLWNRKNMIFTFYDYGGDPKFSYIDYDYHGVITNIVEKEYIDPGDKIACTGAYGFASVHDLYKYSSYIMEKKWCFKDEYYVSTVIDSMLRDHKFTFHILDNKDYFSLGTPEQVRAFEHVFLFDLDGTLVNTDALYIYIWNRILYSKWPDVQLTIDADFFEANIKGHSDTNFLKSLIPSITPEEIRTISKMKDDLFIEHVQMIEIYDGAAEFIQQLQNSRIAIVSNSNRLAASKVLDKFGLNKLVNVLIAAEDCEKTKPDAEPYRRAIDRLDAIKAYESDKCIVFEDSVTGYMSAKNADIKHIMIKLDGYGDSYGSKTSKSSKTNDVLMNLKNKKFYEYRELNANTLLSDHTNADIIRRVYKNDGKSQSCIYNIQDTAKDIKAGGGYICNVYSYKITMKDESYKNIIMKISNLDNPLADTATKLDLYNNEKLFYDKFAVKVRDILNVPKCYGTCVTGSKIAILLEDLNKYSGCFGMNLNNNVEKILQILRDISRLHLAFYYEDSDSCDIKEDVKKMNDIKHYRELIRERYEIFVNKNSLFIPEWIKKRFDILASKFDDVLDRLSTYPLSLCHGDLKSPNLFYGGAGEKIYFLDWQYLNLSKGVTDVVFFMCESIDFDVVMCDLICNYYYMLIKNKNPLYEYSTFMYELKLAICAFPFVVAVWFNSEDPNILVNKTFPLRFLRNYMKYFDYLIDMLFLETLNESVQV